MTVRARFFIAAAMTAALSLQPPCAVALHGTLAKLLKARTGGKVENPALKLFPPRIHVTLSFGSKYSDVLSTHEALFGKGNLYDVIPRLAGAPDGSALRVSLTRDGHLAIQTEHDFYESYGNDYGTGLGSYRIGQFAHGRSDRVVGKHEGIFLKLAHTRPPDLLSLVTMHRIEAASLLKVRSLKVQIVNDAGREHFLKWGYKELDTDRLFFDTTPNSESMKKAAEHAAQRGFPFQDSHEYIVVNR